MEDDKEGGKKPIKQKKKRVRLPCKRGDKIIPKYDPPSVREVALKRYGLTPNVWASTLKAELEATKVKVFMDKDSKIIYSESLIDHKIRQAARQDLGEYLGIKPPQQSEIKVQGVKFIIED